MEVKRLTDSIARIRARVERDREKARNTITSLRASACEAELREHAPLLARHFPDELAELMAPQEPAPITCERCGAPRRYELELHRGRWIPPKGCGECQLRALLAERGLPRRYQGAELSDLPQAIQDLAGQSVYVHGPVGSGKTWALAAVMRDELVKRRNAGGPTVTWPRFTTAPRFLMELRSTFNRGAGENELELVEKYSAIPGKLFLDDLGAEQTTEWSRQHLYILLDGRWAEHRPTLISGNLPLDDLARRLDDRIASRIAGMCRVIELTGRDRRLRAAG